MTKELDFSNQVPLPNNSYGRAKRKLNKSKNIMIDPTVASSKRSFSANEKSNYDEAIDIDELLKEPVIEEMTVDYLDLVLNRYKKKVPTKTKEAVVSFVNNCINKNNSTFSEYYRDLFVDSIGSIFSKNSRISLMEYAKACQFVSYRAAGDTKTAAYIKCFPEKVQRMQREGQPTGHLHKYADMYSNNKTVVEVFARSLVPSHLMYQDLYHKAIKVTADIMINEDVSPKVRAEAANNLMTHLKQPEIAKLDIKVDGGSLVEQFIGGMRDLAEQQRKMIEVGQQTVSDISRTVFDMGDEEEGEFYEQE